MTTRIIVAGLLGGVAMFIWSTIAHTVLPLGEVGVREMSNEQPVVDALRTNQFTAYDVMRLLHELQTGRAWLAFDRAIKLVENYEDAPSEHVGRWRKIRDQIHAEVCDRGYDKKKKAFTQVYGSEALDASLLTMPLIGFLPTSNKRVRSTVGAIERELMEDGFVRRYRPNQCGVDGLPGTEGIFISCSFWLACCWHLLGRKKKAKELFERLLDLRNDLGLFSEEYDPREKRQLGNFPQALSHVSMVACARILGNEDLLFARAH